MQEIEYTDGSKWVEMFGGKNEAELKRKLKEAYERASNGPEFKKLIQRIIAKTEACPCGSGIQFQHCCMRRLAKGKDFVKFTPKADTTNDKSD